ncbi:MAG: hypothetical protein QM636_21250 [Rhizobium sp.]
MTVLARFRVILTLWLLVRSILLLNRLSATRDGEAPVPRRSAKSAIRARYGGRTFLNFEPRASPVEGPRR